MNILILGIGNILFQDEGMGAHFVHYLDEKYEFKNEQNSVSIVDGGTLAHRLIPLIVKFDHVIVIDCVDALNSKPGDVYFLILNMHLKRLIGKEVHMKLRCFKHLI